MKTILARALGIGMVAALAAGCGDQQRSASGPPGEPATLSAPLVLAPAAPSNLVVFAVNAGQVNLSWTDNATDEAELRVQRAEDEGFSVLLVESPLPADSTQFTDFTTEGLHTYFYRVLAVNVNGASPPSEVVRVFTPASSPTVEVVTPAGSPAVFQSGVLNVLDARATGFGAPIAGAEFQLLFEDEAGTYLAQDISAQPDQDPYVIPPPLSSAPVDDTTSVPPLPPSAIVELQIYGRVAQAGTSGNGFEWRIGGIASSPTFYVYESASTRFPRPRRPVVGDAVWVTAYRTAAPGPLVAQRITFRAPEPQPIGPAAYKLAALYKGVIQSFLKAHRVPGVSYGGQTAVVFNAADGLNVPFRYDYPTVPGFPAFVDDGMLPGNAVEVRFWVSRPVATLPVARQVFPQVQAGNQSPTNPNLTHINDDPVPMGLPPGSFVQFMITGVVTDIDQSRRTWQLGDPADPTVVYGHALTLPISDLFRTIPDIGDWVIVTARRTLDPGPLIADQILILFDGPAPAFAIPEVGVQVVYLYNGVVTDVGADNGRTRWTVSSGGINQQFIMDDPHDPAVIDRGSLPSIGIGSLVTVEFIPSTQVLPEDNWAPLAFDQNTQLWSTSPVLPAVPADRAGTLFVRTADTAKQTRSLALPAQLLAGLPNQAPVAANDGYSVTGTQELVVAAPGVLGNDSDPESGLLSAHLISGPAGVSAFTLNPDGSFSFTYGSSPAVSTPVTFTYQVSDGALFSNPATVTVTVNPVPNQAPVASNDSYTATGTQTLTVAAPGVLLNDSDPELQALSAELVSAPAGVSAFALNADGSFSFTYGVNPPVSTPVTFTYRVSDGALFSDTATVTVTVIPIPNRAPIAALDSYAVTGTETLVVAAPGVLGNDSDADLDVLSAHLVSAPVGASAFTFNPDGSFSFTYGTSPAVRTPVTFTYQVADGALFSNIATVTVTVNPASTVQLAFAPSADARVVRNRPNANFGTSSVLGVDLFPMEESYLKFDVTGAGTVRSATLRLYVTDGSSNGPLLYRTGTGWTETGITWNSRPAAIGPALGNLGSVASGGWVEYDVTAAVTGNGVHAFKLAAESSNGVDASSREGLNPPQLLVVSAGGFVAGCVPTTCADAGLNCGTISDGCGGTVACGACAAPETCSGGGVANVCGQAAGGQTFTFTASADARAVGSSPSANFGAEAWIGADRSPSYESYVMFGVSGLTGTVQSAKLRLYVTDGSSNGPGLYATGTAWTETGITWNNRPATGAALGDLGAVSGRTWVEYDVTAAVSADGTYAFKLVPESSDSAQASSREGSNPPQLVITTGQ